MAEKAKFQFNGQTYSVKGRLCHDIVKYYVEQNPNVTLAALQKAFNTATRMIVATPEMALTVKNSDGKPGGDYYMKEEDRIAIKKGEVVVWPERYFEPFMEQVKVLGMNVVIQEQEDKVPADSKEAAAESPLDKAVAKIKKSMKDNGLSVFYLFSGDYNYALDEILEDVKKAMPKEALEDFDSDDVMDFLSYSQLEFGVSYWPNEDGGYQAYTIRKIEYKNDELLFSVDEVDYYEGNNRMRLHENQTVDDMMKFVPNQTDAHNVEKALKNIANYYIDRPFLVAASKVADFDLYDYCN